MMGDSKDLKTAVNAAYVRFFETVKHIPFSYRLHFTITIFSVSKITRFIVSKHA